MFVHAYRIVVLVDVKNQLIVLIAANICVWLVNFMHAFVQLQTNICKIFTFEKNVYTINNDVKLIE